MLKIRLKKLGHKKSPFYRIIVIDSRKPRNGIPLSEVGWYDPIKKKSHINRQRTLFYLNNGAQPTETVVSLLKKAALL